MSEEMKNLNQNQGTQTPEGGNPPAKETTKEECFLTRIGQKVDKRRQDRIDKWLEKHPGKTAEDRKRRIRIAVATGATAAVAAATAAAIVLHGDDVDEVPLLAPPVEEPELEIPEAEEVQDIGEIWETT